MALIPWWIRYPNVNDEIMNLDWLLKVSNENTEKISNFINLNTIKYADPILWDITSQYEANTITVDPQTGDAYISTKAVPYGVSLSNTDYWTKIYNYADEINKLEEQIAAANERLSTTASGPRAIGDLVWLNGLLYEVTASMIAGDSYVTGSNCKKVTLEEVIKLLRTSISNEVTARTEADAALQQNINNEAQTRGEADTALQEAINNITFGNTKYNVVNEMPASSDDDSVYEDIESDIDFNSIATKSLSEVEFTAINRILADRENNIIEIVTYNVENENSVYHNLLNGLSKYGYIKKAMMLFGSNITCLQETITGKIFNIKDFCKSSLMKNMYSVSVGIASPLLTQDITTFSYDDIVSTQFIPFTSRVGNEGIVKTIYNINDKHLVVYNVHIHYISGTIQDAQWLELYNIFNDDNITYRVIAGDLNVNLATYSGVNRFITGGYSVLNRGEYITYPANNIAVDGMITTSNISVLDREVLINDYVIANASDHLPFRARLQLN